MTRSISVAAVLAAVAGSAGVAVAQPFPVTSIGSVAGGPSIAWGVSSGSGQPVVGETDTNVSTSHRACTFTTGILATNTGSGPGGFFTPKVAYRISATNLIYCGSGFSSNLTTRAFRNYGGLTTELGTTNPFLQNSEARGVNNLGTIVGSCYANNSYPGAGNNNSFAFKWVPNDPSTPTNTTGVMSNIPLHAAYYINDSNLVVGSIGSLPYQLNLNTNALTNMGSLGGAIGSGIAVSNNNAGVAVGHSPAPNNFRHAMRWTAAGGMQDIHPVPLNATAESFAHDVNAGGVIVGKFYSSATGPGGHAFIYNPATGVWRDLNTWLFSGSGWVLEEAYGINDQNCVVGRGKHMGQTRGFKMCVVPPQPPQAPCGGNPLPPIPSQSACPGTTKVFAVDPTSVGGGQAGAIVEVEWAFTPPRSGPNAVARDFQPIVDGLNSDPDSGEPLFMATLSHGGGTVGGQPSVAITPVGGPGGGGAGGAAAAGYAIRAWVRGPCDTMYTDASTLFVAPADVGQQGGLPGGDGQYDNNDFIVFIDMFFDNHPGADLGVQGGLLGRDGMFDNNDFIVYIDQFFHACM